MASCNCGAYGRIMQPDAACLSAQYVGALLSTFSQVCVHVLNLALTSRSVHLSDSTIGHACTHSLRCHTHSEAKRMLKCGMHRA